MHLEISHVVNHPIERVWNVLLDLDVLARVMPGVEKFEEVVRSPSGVGG